MLSLRNTFQIANELERWFDDVSRSQRRPLATDAAGSQLNIARNEAGDVELTLPVPGVAPERVSSELDGQYIVVRVQGEQADQESADKPADETTKVLRKERRVSNWERRIRLGYRPQADRVSAAVRNGVLRIVVSAPQKQEALQIPINTDVK